MTIEDYTHVFVTGNAQTPQRMWSKYFLTKEEAKLIVRLRNRYPSGGHLTDEEIGWLREHGADLMALALQHICKNIGVFRKVAEDELPIIEELLTEELKTA
jgi:hypothetical protein